MTTAIVERENELQVDGYKWLPLFALRQPSTALVDIFSLSSDNDAPELLHAGRIPRGAEQIAQIERQGYSKVLVRKSDFAEISRSVHSQLDRSLLDNRLTIAERFALLQIGVWEQLEYNSRRLYSERFVEVAKEAGKLIAQLLCESPPLAHELYDVTLRDESGAVHLTNVTAYTILLAQEMGHRDLPELTKIAIGAMLHEFGKLFLPVDLLLKTGRLSIQERELFERVPLMGYEKLHGRTDLEFGQLMMVYQQHERFDGSGYPVGIENDEIHPWVRLLIVADVFDTMISRKAYRRENRTAEALLYIADNSSLHFDPKVALCWLTIFQQR